MAITYATPNTLVGSLQPRSEAARAVNALVIVVLGTVLLTISAKINIPLIPVPVTFQSMTVALLAGAFGWRLGMATIALYIVEGLAGLPVFAGGGGAAYIFSPTFGFIVGWLPMALLVGWFADNGAGRRVLPLFGAMLLGDTISFLLGFGWLIAMSGGASWIDQTNVFGSAFDIAVKPFLAWDVLKMAFAAITVTGAWAFLRRVRNTS